MANEPAPARYHPAHVALHWLTGFMVIGSIVIGMVFLDSPNTPEKIPYLQFHSLWGFVLAVLLIARVTTLVLFKRPAAATTGNALLDLVARIVHILIICVRILNDLQWAWNQSAGESHGRVSRTGCIA